MLAEAQKVIANLPIPPLDQHFLWTPFGAFAVMAVLGFFLFPLIAWVYPFIAAIVGFSFGFGARPSWFALALGGLGGIYSIVQYRSTGEKKWGHLRWLFGATAVGALLNQKGGNPLDLF